MKIILSRKGFDGANGGVASPLFEGKLFTFPIPEIHEVSDGHRIEYSEILTNIGGYPFAKVLEDLTAARRRGNTRIHHDPDIDPGSFPRQPGWRGLFGQSGVAQEHLRRNSVDTGDLFLFFGWFRETEIHEGRFRFVRKAPDKHIIFGYLEVGEVWELGPHPEVPEGKNWAAYHPHFGHEKKNNAIYVAGEQLSFAPQLPGYGIFRTFDEELILSDPADPEKRRSYWLLPKCFARQNGTLAFTYHPEHRWGETGNSVTLKSVGRGQEFVCDAGEYPDVRRWARELVMRHASQRDYRAKAVGTT